MNQFDDELAPSETMAIINSIRLWLVNECGMTGHVVCYKFIETEQKSGLVSVIVRSDNVTINDIDNVVYMLDYANPFLFDIVLKIATTGRP